MGIYIEGQLPGMGSTGSSLMLSGISEELNVREVPLLCFSNE